jgi:hypothetical protein
MPEEHEPTTEKPVYETPVVVELNEIQRGEGGGPAVCTNGSGNAFDCVAGAGVL